MEVSRLAGVGGSRWARLNLSSDSDEALGRQAPWRLAPRICHGRPHDPRQLPRALDVGLLPAVCRVQNDRLHVAHEVFDRIGEGERGVFHLYQTFTRLCGTGHQWDASWLRPAHAVTLITTARSLSLQLSSLVEFGRYVGHSLTEFRIKPALLGHPPDAHSGALDGLLDRELSGESTEGLEGSLLAVGGASPSPPDSPRTSVCRLLPVCGRAAASAGRATGRSLAPEAGY